jgi:Rieske Fe-S protein
MDPDTPVARRTVLAAGVAGAGALTLAACSPSSPDPSATPTATAGTELARLADITVGQAVAAKLNGQNVLVSRPTASTAACFSAICTHQGCTVMPDGDRLSCPCHGSQYDPKTGDVLRGPAPKPLAEIPVTVQNGQVVTSGSA